VCFTQGGLYPAGVVNANHFTNLLDVPSGGISDPPILVNLLHALHLTGFFGGCRKECLADPSRKRVVDFYFQRSSLPPRGVQTLCVLEVADSDYVSPKKYEEGCFPLNQLKQLQSGFLLALSVQAQVVNIVAELHKEVKVVLQLFAFSNIPRDW
jgi:hypothetical protein